MDSAADGPTAVRGRIEALVEAVRAADLDALKAFYAPDIVSFDIEPPLQHVGAAAKWKNWEGVFAAHQLPLDYTVRNLTILGGGDLVCTHCFARISGTLKNGKPTASWVRWTACFRQVAGRWLIAHDHISVPLDLPGGRALLALEPA